MQYLETIRRIVVERIHQDKKWGTQFVGRPDERWLAVLVEEVGEVAMALNDGESDERIEAELIQVAAVVVSWLQFRTPRDSQIPNDPPKED